MRSDAPASQPPSGQDATFSINEDTPRTLVAADFGFSDPNDNPPDLFKGVLIERLPLAGALTIDGFAVAAGESISMLPDSRMGWTPLETSRTFVHAASSADGTRLLAAAGSVGFLYTSTDSGQTWTQRADSNPWSAVASSADGTRLFAVNGALYVSLDGGQSWTVRQPQESISCVAVSQDGTRVVVGGRNGGTNLYASTNSGVSWTTLPIRAEWSALASSADGTRLLAATLNGSLYTSSNSGAAWTARESARSWTAVASSADGLKLAAAVNSGALYLSQDGGTTWTPRESARIWTAIASSADGNLLAASVRGGRLYTSRNAGLTWSARENIRQWSAIASSSDGNKLLAAADRLYTSTAAVPVLVYKPAANASGTGYASFTFQVQDDGLGASTLDPTPKTLTLNVLQVNDAPVASITVPDQIATERSSFSYQFPANTFTDTEAGSVLTYSATRTDGSSLSGWLSFNPATRTFAGTPGQADTGSTAILLTATDNGSPPLSATTTFFISVQPVATPPAGMDGSALLTRAGTYNFLPGDFGFSDPDDFPQNYFSRVKLTTLPFTGELKVDGVNVSVGDYVRIQPSLPGQIWTPTGPASQPFISVASSADGQTLAAASFGGYLHVSRDGGVSWMQRATFQNWFAITSSADGEKLAAVVQSGGIYTSDNGGTTWIDRPSGVQVWRAITSSADGTRLAAIQQSGRIHTSADSGATWTAQDVVRNWYGIASSADGLKLAAVVQDGLIYTSTDAGVSWTPRASSRTWRSIASSADGTRLVAAVENGRIYTSADAGVTWIPRELNRNWYYVSSSADGIHLAAVARNDLIYVSRDGGISWFPRDGSRNWRSIASSSNGTRLIAAENGGRLYASSILPAQTLTYLTQSNDSGRPFSSFTFQVEDDGTAAGQLDATPARFTINVLADSAFEQWADANGVPRGPAAAGSGNILRFAFGMAKLPAPPSELTLKPNEEITRGLPILDATGTPFKVIFGLRKNAGLNCQVQFSGDLNSWETSPAFPRKIAEDEVIEVQQVPFPALLGNGLPPRFFRVWVASP